MPIEILARKDNELRYFPIGLVIEHQMFMLQENGWKILRIRYQPISHV